MMRSKALLSMSLTLALAGHALAADIHVDQAGQKFSVSAISVKVGDSVHFLNHDDVIHNIITIDADDDQDDHGLQKPGETIDETFTAAGEFTVRCSIHPKMKMSITVQ